MVNTGKPSRGCAICKKRKIKCDLAEPACSRCLKSGWHCPGYPTETDLTFRDQTALVLRNSRSKSLKGADVTTSYSRRVRDLSPSVADRATAYFLCQYVFSADDKSGYHEYIPNLLAKERSEGSLGTIVKAAGLAALANSRSAQEWKTEAYIYYGKALEKLQVSLQDPVEVKSDQTLAAVMLMGLFDSIAYTSSESMASFSQHTLAAARCIELRGPNQFRSPAAVKLYTHMRRIVVMTCHQLQEPLPYALERWSKWAESKQATEEIVSNRFSEINGRLALIRAKIKHQGITNPATVTSLLLPIDKMIETWKLDLPASWEFKSYRSLSSTSNEPFTYDHQYDVYHDIWTASMWNSYRSVRLLIHEAIIAATLKYGTVADKKRLKPSIQVLRSMANEVCHSVPYLLGLRQTSSGRLESTSTQGISSEPTPGGYLLLWPLFLSGMLRTTTLEQRRWITSVMRGIGHQMGLQLALSMACALEQKSLSFSHDDAWFIGEFYPN